GDWQHWFTEKDVAFFKPAFSGFLKEFDYADDWQLAVPQTISPEHASGYVQSLIAERRAKALLRQPDRAQEMLTQARRTFKTFCSRHLAQMQTGRDELEKEMNNLQV